MNPNGRPKTRSLEPQMIAIFKLINREMINEESTNVSNACRSVIKKSNLIKFIDNSLPESKKLTDVCIDDKNLRKRYYRAIECSKDAEKYPILSETVKQLQASLESEINRHKQWRDAHEREDRDGRLVAYKEKLPIRFARKR